MKTKRFFVYTGDPSDPQNQMVRAVKAKNEEIVWAMFPHAIGVQRYDPVDPKWRRTAEPDWEKLEAGMMVM